MPKIGNVRPLIIPDKINPSNSFTIVLLSKVKNNPDERIIMETDITRKFVEALNTKFQGRGTPLGAIKFVTQAGGRYFDKIILPNCISSPDGSSAHAFIERATGKLYRAASWTHPVVDARYDLSDKEEFLLAVELADPYGNYLRRDYARRT